MILIFLIRKKLLTNKNSAKSLFVRKNLQVENWLNRPDIRCHSSQTTSSRPQIFCKIGFLKSIVKLLRKYSFRSLFLTKFKCFYVNFLNFLRTRFLNNNGKTRTEELRLCRNSNRNINKTFCCKWLPVKMVRFFAHVSNFLFLSTNIV